MESQDEVSLLALVDNSALGRYTLDDSTLQARTYEESTMNSWKLMDNTASNGGTLDDSMLDAPPSDNSAHSKGPNLNLQELQVLQTIFGQIHQIHRGLTSWAHERFVEVSGAKKVDLYISFAIQSAKYKMRLLHYHPKLSQVLGKLSAKDILRHKIVHALEQTRECQTLGKQSKEVIDAWWHTLNAKQKLYCKGKYWAVLEERIQKRAGGCTGDGSTESDDACGCCQDKALTLLALRL